MEAEVKVNSEVSVGAGAANITLAVVAMPYDPVACNEAVKLPESIRRDAAAARVDVVTTGADTPSLYVNVHL
jgi:hypothetical protein